MAELVAVDEMGSHIALTPLYGRAPQGERAIGSVPRNWQTNTPLIGALTLSGIEGAMTLDGAVDPLAFATFVEHVLCPRLRPGQVVMVDNLASHKGARGRELIEGAGCRLLFFPSYSPDFSPIKQALRRTGARTKEALEAAMAEAIELITAADARGFFRHCGFHLPAQPL